MPELNQQDTLENNTGEFLRYDNDIDDFKQITHRTE